jgi:predicted transcriptional regulator
MELINKLQKLPNRNKERILSFIQDNPGCYLRQIRNELSISMGSVQYHSHQLQKTGKITSTREGLYKLHFQSGVFKDDEKKMLQVLNQETPREIIMLIIEQRNPTQTDIVNRLRISAPSVHWHVRRLIASNMIEEVKEGKYKKYMLCCGNAKYIGELLKNHHPTIWNRWSSRIAEMFLSLSNEHK